MQVDVGAGLQVEQVGPFGVAHEGSAGDNVSAAELVHDARQPCLPEAEVGAPGSRVGTIGGGQRDEHGVKPVQFVRARAGGGGLGRRLAHHGSARYGK